MNKREASDRDYDAFVESLADASIPTDVPPGVTEFLTLSREAAFRCGWNAGQQWQATEFGEAPTARIPRNVRTLAVGESAWIQPLAVIESERSGALFVDPRFPIRRAASTGFTLRLRHTEEGYIAEGPTDQHRISLSPTGPSLLPLSRLDAAPPSP